MKNISFYTKCTSGALLVLLFSVAGFAQKSLQQVQAQKRAIEQDPKVQFVEMAADKGTPQTIRFDFTKADAYRVADAPKIFRKHLQLKASDKLAFLKNTPYRQGMSVARYQQFYNGIKVEHGQFTALSKGDRLAAMNGEFYEMEGKGIAPTLTEAQALESALRFVGAKQYVWEYVESLRRGMLPANVMQQIDQAYGEYFPKGELVFVDDFYKPGTEPELAWKFNIYANEPLSRAWIYVSAHDGHILLRDAIIKHATTTVQTRYAGIQEIGTTFVEGLNPNPEYAGGENYYILLDETRGGGIQTYDMNGLGGAPVSIAILYNLATDHVDDDNTWTTVEHVRDPAPTIEEAINDDIAWDAHWGASMVYDYWLERHGRLSYDGENAKINSYIHYGEGYDNAFWNGSVMTYGDGSYKNFGAFQVNGFAPLTSLDVCGHEIGHAVCEHTSDLVYERESGAMNEGFSDIWAACMEYYVQERFPGTSFGYVPFKIGEQIDFRTGPNDPNNALRYMDNPKGAGDPDTYGGTNWTNPECGTPTLANDYCGVHGNSGVLNKWFYLLVMGSGNAPDDGQNDQGETYDVDGLGFETAEQIAFGTELLLTPTSTFAQARAASISFARATFGPCSPEEEATTNAWFAVGVGDAFTCSGGAALTGFLTVAEEVVEGAENTGACNDSKTHEVKLSVNSVLNFNLQVGGTATQGRDYFLSTTNVSHGSTAFAIKNITITIVDDAALEGPETIVLTIPPGNGNVPGSDVYTLTIRDDDVAPVVGVGEKSLLYERFLTSNIPAGWQVITTLGSMNQWNFGGYLGRAYVSATGFFPTYEPNNNPTDIILRSPLLDARGLSQVSVSFDWTAGGETDVAIGGGAPFDYGNLTYSYDGVTFYDLDEVFVGDNFGTTIQSGTYEGDLSALLANQQFYLGWRWRNDPLLGNVAYSFSFDEVRVNAQTRQVETELDHAGEEYLGPNATVFFYSADDGQLVATIKNNTSHDFGCTSLSVEREGTGASSWYNGFKSTNKAIRIEPEFNSTSANVEVTLYYTQGELTGYETASGTLRTQLNLYKTTASHISGANAGNSTESIATYTAIYKTPATVIAGSFKATVTGTLGAVVMARKSIGMPIIVPPGSGAAQTADPELTIYPNPADSETTLVLPTFTGEQAVDIALFNLDGQQVWQERRSSNGGEQVKVDVENLPAGVYLMRLKTADGLVAKKLIIE